MNYTIRLLLIMGLRGQLTIGSQQIQVSMKIPLLLRQATVLSGWSGSPTEAAIIVYGIRLLLIMGLRGQLTPSSQQTRLQFIQARPSPKMQMRESG